MGELSEAPLSYSDSFVLSMFRQYMKSGRMSSDCDVSVPKTPLASWEPCKEKNTRVCFESQKHSISHRML